VEVWATMQELRDFGLHCGAVVPSTARLQSRAFLVLVILPRIGAGIHKRG
jgi:hypothetical protein